METLSHVVVTGAETGLGRLVVALLTARGHGVTALVHSLDNAGAMASGGRLSVRKFDLLVAEDPIPVVHGPAVLVHLASGRTPADHLAMARAARLLADAMGATRTVSLSALAEARHARDSLTAARRLTETIFADGAQREVLAVRAGLLDDELTAGAATGCAKRFRFLCRDGWARIALSDRSAVAQAVASAVAGFAVSGSAVVTTVPASRHVRAWRLRRVAAA